MGIFLSAQICAWAIPVFDSRAAWNAAFEGPRWDVDLGGKPNGLSAGDTLTKGAPIYLPPEFAYTLSFDSKLDVVYGKGWKNYAGSGDPLVLSTQNSSLTGTFNNDGMMRFGFEVLPMASGDLTIELSDGTKVTKYFDARNGPQFFGWVGDGTQSGIKGFTISGADKGLLIGNFIVPDTASTLILLGVSLAGMALFGRKALPRLKRLANRR